MLVTLIFRPFGGFWTLRKLANSQVPVLNVCFRALYKLSMAECTSYIARQATFRGRPEFPDGLQNIFISKKAVIGEGCIIYQQTVIGSVTTPGSSRIGAPVIGDHVLIGAGAKIIGNVHVGNNCRIGANAVVYQDVPDNCVVVSGEMRVIQKEHLDNRLCYFSDRTGELVTREHGKEVPADPH